MTEMTECILKKYKGEQLSPETAPKVVLRRCGPDDFAEMFAVQTAVRAAMPRPELFLPNSEAEMQGDLENSLCIAACVDGRMAAYFILRYCGESDHNYANYLDVPKSDLRFWANADSVAVLPDYRGNGLQQKLFTQAVLWRNPSIVGIGCTVSPENAYSLENAKALGFTVFCRRKMYGKHDRYVMRCFLTPLPGEYRHFKGNPYRVLGMAKHSETQEPMVLYQALYGDGGIWVRPAAMWFEHIDRGDYHGPRFVWEKETVITKE